MIFHPHHKTVDNINISIDNVPIKRTEVIKFLGLYIDPLLSWSSHISKITTSVSKIIGVLYKIKYFVPDHVLKSLYNTLILPHLNYCNIVWGNTYPTRLQKLFLLQKKAVRIITNSSHLTHTPPLFSKLSLLNIFDIHRHQCAIFVYKFIHKQLPVNFDSYFLSKHDVHSHNTRTSHHLFAPSVNCDLFKRSILYNGVKVWNQCDFSIKNLNSVKLFANKLKISFLNNYDHV